MDWATPLIIATVTLATLMLMGQWVAFGMMTTGVVVMFAVDGTAMFSTLSSITYNAANSFTLSAIPMFILMGELLLRGGVSGRFYEGISVLFTRVPGSLLHANIASAALFSAVSGSSVATGAAIGTVSLSALDKAQYSRKLTLTSLAGGGSLGMLIPPSLGAIVYAGMVEVSVSRMFLAGVGPALLLVVLLMGYTVVRVAMAPELAPRAEGTATTLASLTGIAPLVLLMVIVLGSIYGGVATPTEAGALGAACALLVAKTFGNLTKEGLARALRGTLKITCMIMFLVIGSQVLSFAFVNAGITRGVVAAVSDLQPAHWQVFLGLVIFYCLLGMVIDGVSLMLVTVPVVTPIVLAAGFDPIWFGVLLIVFIELGQLTPPIGLMLFVMKGIAVESPMQTIVRASTPVWVMILLVAVVMFAFPSLAMWLPSLT